MFETHRAAAYPIQVDPNVILWSWVGLGIVAPFFMMEIASLGKDGEFIFHRMTSSANVLRNQVLSTTDGYLKRVFLLSPGNINGSDAFQLDALDSVFSSPNNLMNMLFRLTDGRTLYSSLEGNRLDESQYTVNVFKSSAATMSSFSSK